MIARLARFYGGALTIAEMREMTMREILPWWDEMHRQILADGIIEERAMEDKAPLSQRRLDREIMKKLEAEDA